MTNVKLTLSVIVLVLNYIFYKKEIKNPYNFYKKKVNSTYIFYKKKANSTYNFFKKEVNSTSAKPHFL